MASLIVSPGYIGDFESGATVRFKITTMDSTGAAAPVSGGMIATVYKDESFTQSATGLTITEGFDGLAGFHQFVINTSASSSFYATGSDFQVVILGGSIGGVALGNNIVASFSINNRSGSDSSFNGDGDIPVDHNTGGTDTLLYRVNSVAADNVIIKAYLKSEYDAGTRTVRGTTYTGPDGRWLNPLMLNAGTYTVVARLPGVSDAVATTVVVS